MPGLAQDRLRQACRRWKRRDVCVSVSGRAAMGAFGNVRLAVTLALVLVFAMGFLVLSVVAMHII